MSFTPNPSELFTPFLASTYVVPEEEDRMRAFLGEKFSEFSDVINDKKIGVYLQAAEALNGEKWFFRVTNKTRNGFQAIAYIPQFPNNTMLTLKLNTVPAFPIPNINPQFVVTQVWGSASRPCSAVGNGDGDYFSFFSAGNSKIDFTMSDTTIVITTHVDMTAYSGFIVVQYLRDGL